MTVYSTVIISRENHIRLFQASHETWVSAGL